MAETTDAMKRQVAVALRYNRDRDRAPRLSAKGFEDIARKILRLAREHGVPIKEDRDLAGLLVKLDVGAEIPDELYAIVAELFAFLYRMNRSFV